jgi:PAS domain S-box-containing protein
MLNLKNRLVFFILALVSFAFALFLLFNSLYIEKKNNINSLENKLYKLENNLLHSFNDINLLLFRTINDTDLDLTDQNILLLRLRKNIPKLNEEFSVINAELKKLPDKSTLQLSKIIQHYHSYIAYLNEITKLLDEKAAVNTGIYTRINQLEQQLRDMGYFNAQTLEKLSTASRTYFLFKDPEMIGGINWITKTLESEVKRQTIAPEDKIKVSSLLSYYNVLFNKLKEIDLMLDHNVPNSYTSKLIVEKENITDQFDYTFETLTTFKEGLSKYSIIYYSLLFVILIVVGLLLNQYIARLVVKPISWLTGNIIKILYDKHDEASTAQRFQSFKEINNLYKKILVLLQYLKDQEDKRQLAQKQLKQSEHRYRELSDMLPQSIYETNSLGQMTYVNRAWFKTFGYENSDMDKGVNIIETIVSETGEAVMGNRRFIHSDFIGIRKDGTTFPAIVYSNQVIKNGKMSGIRGIIIDNTERKKYIELLKKEKEQAEKLDQQKTSFLTNMSHEIRTPMNAILGFADLLTSLELNEGQKEEFVNHINQSSQHILHLIDDIIDLAKIETGELNVKKSPAKINALMHDMFLLYEGILKKSHKNNKVELMLNMPQNELVLDTDAHRLKQVLNNLLGNALKYTDEGYIEFGYNLSEKQLATFYVKDTGGGISNNLNQEIFERLNQGRQPHEKGKGLGLTLSKRVVELLGGKIWVTSDPHAQTCFYFTLPLSKPLRAVTQEYTLPSLPEYNWKDKLILVAEDEDLNYKVVKEFISKTMAKVIRAYDGEEAVELCHTNKKIDLVLMDIKMPRKNGYDATKEIKGFRKNLPVIALTAYALADEKERCFSAGCDGYIAKPFKKILFLNTLSPFLAEEIDIKG